MGIFADEEAHKAWNWVLEMYGYALATYRLKQHVGMKTYENFLAHPPFDKNEVAEGGCCASALRSHVLWHPVQLNYAGDPFYLLHLTYPLRYNSSGGVTENENQTVW